MLVKSNNPTPTGLDAAKACQVALCCRGGDPDLLPRLRKWWFSRDWPAHAQEAPVSFSSLSDAMDWYCEAPTTRPIVACGHSTSEVQEAFLRARGGTAHRGRLSHAAPIIIGPHDREPFEITPDDAPLAVSASPIDSVREFAVCRHFAPEFQVRQISGPQELAAYFRLRYEVWNGSGYLPASRRAEKSRLELDYTDRTATPMGLFTAAGTLIGCVRVLRNFGREVPRYVDDIAAIIREADDPVLDRLFQRPLTPTQPFDLLEYFPDFRACYSAFVRNGVRVGELSRVIVAQPWRGRRLSEYLVYRALSLARRKKMSKLFLACRTELTPLYAGCGFETLPGYRADRFGDIPIESQIMGRKLP